MHIIRVSPAYFPHLYHGGSVVADYELDKEEANHENPEQDLELDRETQADLLLLPVR